ncbi:hypothetical protein HYH03_012225 [Edaphochlamys debaryana]|uniref:Uncharacterized protein n=1 Tax=Edaphochlamys debaryana TaxID=47281 RepID=A0A835XYG7_9CHLO|nr:hypothetical protein HYH03_012225 [Edaphochlamys debaryana]|eukprot:KAG2489200.1 hypothetical protein HYH03_012225 [Edaphochlamys debaryana]
MALSISSRGSPAASRRPAPSTARGARPAILPRRHRLSPASARCSAQPPPSGSGASASTSLLAAAGADPAAANAYGKPFTKSELSALQAAVTYLSSPGGGGAAAASEGPSALRGRILELMRIRRKQLSTRFRPKRSRPGRLIPGIVGGRGRVLSRQSSVPARGLHELPLPGRCVAGSYFGGGGVAQAKRRASGGECLSFNGAPIANGGTAPFRSGERISYTPWCPISTRGNWCSPPNHARGFGRGGEQGGGRCPSHLGRVAWPGSAARLAPRPPSTTNPITRPLNGQPIASPAYLVARVDACSDRVLSFEPCTGGPADGQV